MPSPARVQVRVEDYVPVPFLPRPAPVEIVPPQPEGYTGLVWADGAWEWESDRFRWAAGAWVVPPPGARRARWVIVRRTGDGQLFFAPSTWRDAKGNLLAAPSPLSRARRRTVGPAGDVAAPGEREARTDLDE